MSAYRSLLLLLLSAGATALLHAAETSRPKPAPAASGWDAVPGILARIKAPEFPARDFPITSYGASADAADNTAAIAKAIEACVSAGGGHVVVPAGVFKTGAIRLKSRVDLHLADGATLKFFDDPAHYPMVYTRWEGVECMNYSPFIYAFEEHDLGITGHGTLDGSASVDNWWGWTKVGTGPNAGKDKPSRNHLNELSDRGVPVKDRVMGAGQFLRPNFVQPYRCQNILIEGVHIVNSPMWELNPVLSRNIIVRGVDINSHGPNNDGCDPECCSDVLIENCIFETGDDCIAIKSGRNADGRRVGMPSENLIVRNCTMKDGHGGVVLGSEISGDCRNVFVENCKMDSPNLERVLRLKSNAWRGGVLESIFLRNIQVGRVAEAILTVDFLYEEGAKGPEKPVARHIVFENVTSNASPRVLWVQGFPAATIDDIRFTDCTFKGVETAETLAGAGTIVFQRVTIEPAHKAASLSSRAPNTL